VNTSQSQFQLADVDRCTYAEDGGERCAKARSYFYRDFREGTYCPWHSRWSCGPEFATLDENQRDYVLDDDDQTWRKGWQASREGSAHAMLTNDWLWTSSQEWCDVFGCCGRGWAPDEDGEAFGELRAAHLLAQLPVPDWIANPAAYPPRRRSLEVVVGELIARVAELERRPPPIAVRKLAPGVVAY
jgi:hypothetical protein